MIQDMVSLTTAGHPRQRAAGGAPARSFLPVSAPSLAGREREYVLDCLDSTWISSNGKYIERFEQAFAEFCGVQHAMACTNGTVALHLALLALGVGPGDEVIVPTLTYVATANAVAYCGATPVFVDSETQTWNLDPAKLDELITPRTKGIIVVHLFGHMVDMDPVMALARRRGLWVIEDAAEAHGAEYRGKRAGSIGTISTFSFYGNKIVTTGEGGMVVTDDPELAARVRIFKGQGQDPQRRYWFPVIGYNYRMTNICAAIGLAQLEDIDWHMERRREIAQWYAAALSDRRLFITQPELPGTRNAYWMSSVVFGEGFPLERDEAMAVLAKWGIDSRPFFYPLHTLPMYAGLVEGRSFPVAESVAARGINVPSYGGMTRDDVDYVVEGLKALVEG